MCWRLSELNVRNDVMANSLVVLQVDPTQLQMPRDQSHCCHNRQTMPLTCLQTSSVNEVVTTAALRNQSIPSPTRKYRQCATNCPLRDLDTLDIGRELFKKETYNADNRWLMNNEKAQY